MNDIDALKRGCMATFKVIYHQYHPKLYAFLLKKTSSAYLAEEVLQLSFIKLWNSRKSLSDTLDLDIQLFRIARTTAIDELRKDASRNNHINQLEHDIIHVDHLRLDEKAQLNQIERAIEELPPVRKTVFKLSRYNHLSNAEIAEMLGLAEKTVENHINLALKSLRLYRDAF
ncbi:sigma-70 family RNA polymerase sigma factor [Pedobacter sp. SYP-B3415]|uniref:sigma-70 family RNA polymerase sigma factor n=1 Tax=Pedobacter sp. SYP-B3415 TaxID=2496641 RepID=UPI0013ECA7B8|nr:sigma-70 family RNA polymerase sigma factor [Pedobacter sp. SYP-B3415]